MPDRDAHLSVDERRTIRLICGDQPATAGRSTRLRLRESRMPGTLARVAISRAGLDHDRIAVRPAMALRRAAMGDRAAGSPRVLIRVDEFPHAQAHERPKRFGTEAFARFHDVLASEGVPYLLAVLPRLARDYLNPGGDDGEPWDDAEVEMLERLGQSGVTMALHAHTHRTRDPRPRHRTAIGGLRPQELAHRLDGAEQPLVELGLKPRVFVPPFNHFDRAQWDVLSQRYDVVCGGPESVSQMGPRMSPRWIGDAVYLPSYPPLYARAEVAGQAVKRLAERECAVWAPVTLHPGWELDDGLTGLRLFARQVAPQAVAWGQFLDDVSASREAVS